MHIPLRLIWKLVLINSTSLLVAMALIAVSVHWLAGSYFMTLMNEYSIDPSDVHRMFLHAVDRYLIVACLAGFVIASILSSWLNYRLMRPVSQIMLSAACIAKGDFSNRVLVKGCGEIDHLSLAFNSMAENLQRVEKLRKDFVVDVAHELRTPLTNIRGYMEGLRDKVIVADTEVFDSLHEETLRLVRLVEELLQLARADLAKANLHVECFDLAELTKQALKAFEPRFSERRLKVTHHLPMTLIHADKERITQVMTNLLENVVRYSPVGGGIAMSLAIVNQRVKFVITNETDSSNPLLEGSPDAQSLFERFQRGDASRSRELGGAGLGLAIVKELIVAHRGDVGYRFENGNAEFWFELPA